MGAKIMKNRMNTLMSRRSVALVVVFSVCLYTFSAHADKTFRRQERVSGLFYDVQYTVKDDGSIEVKPIATFHNGRWYNVRAGNLEVDPRTTDNKTAVQIDGKTYSVAFLLKDGRVSGTVYAKLENGKWDYSPRAATEEKTVQPTVPPSNASPSTASPGRTGARKGPVVAEFKMYENALKPFGFTAHETEPLLEDGHYAYPNINISASPRITDSTNSLGIGVDININGSTFSSAGKKVLGRYTGADVTAHVNADYHRDFYGSANGIAAGPLINNGVSVDANIQTKTEFGPILGGLARRKAGREARKQIAMRTPKKTRMMERMVQENTEKVAARSNESFHDTVRKLSDIKPDTKGIPFTPELSSKSSTSGARGHLSVALRGNGSEKQVTPPAFEAAPQMATSFVMHEDAINKSVTPLLAGKRIQLGEAFKLVCSNELLKRLSFCKEMDPEAANKIVTFDADRPFHVSFLNGEMKIELNAVHEVEGMSVKATPYTIEATYTISSDGMQRKALTVRERNGNKEPESPGAKPEHAIAGFFNRAVRFIADPVEKAALNDAYANAFKENVEFPGFNVPVKFHAENSKSNPKPNIALQGNFVPLETKSDEGWFAASQAFCTDDMGAIGIHFQNRKTEQGYELVITSVKPGSPAALLDIKVGDRIASYKVLGEESPTAVDSDYTRFTKRVAELAATEATDARRMILVGTDTKGTAFNKTVALCPKNPKTVSLRP
jgi:hypothetical protein